MSERNKPVPNLRLRQIRMHQNLSQAEVAEKIGASNPSVGRWERGETYPDPIYRQRLCQLFKRDAVALGFFAENIQQREEGLQGQTHTQAHVAVPLIPGATTEDFFDSAIPPLPPLGSLVGRDELLEKLKFRLLDDKNAPLAALNGLPGVGKTALAAELVRDAEMKRAFRGGVLWAGLGPKPNIVGLLGRWGTLLGLEAVQTVERSRH